jgi:hypothetical protein
MTRLASVIHWAVPSLPLVLVVATAPALSHSTVGIGAGAVVLGIAIVGWSVFPRLNDITRPTLRNVAIATWALASTVPSLVTLYGALLYIFAGV